jgi:hypothetical protein
MAADSARAAFRAVYIGAVDEQARRQRDRPVGGDRDDIQRLWQAGRAVDHVVLMAFEHQRQACAGVIVRRQNGADHRPLQQQGDMAEIALQQPEKLAAREFAHVERVRRHSRGGIHIAVRRTDQQQSVGAENTADFRHECVVLGKMLDRFEGNDGVETRIGERHGGGAALHEACARRGKGGACVGDCAGIVIEAGDRAGNLCQQRGAVALAAGDVEHVQPAAEAACQEIPVQVLHLHLAADGGGEAFAGEGLGRPVARARKNVSAGGQTATVA